MLYTDFNFEMFERPNLNTFEPKEGFNKGNMFINEYLPYKNYTPTILMPKNEKERILLNLYEYDFALNDLSLYLDLHPEDNYAYKMFQKYVNNYEIVKKEYESKYGPLVLTCDSSMDYKWNKNPFPWESEDSMYV